MISIKQAEISRAVIELFFLPIKLETASIDTVIVALWAGKLVNPTINRYRITKNRAVNIKIFLGMKPENDKKLI